MINLVIIITAWLMIDAYQLYNAGLATFDQNGYELIMLAEGTLIFWLLVIQAFRALDRHWATLATKEETPKFPQEHVEQPNE